MNLEECRNKINDIDDELIQLFIKRMDIATEVARQKRLANLPVFHPDRERAIITRLSQQVPAELAPYVSQLYTTIFHISRSRQHDLNGRSFHGKAIPPYATIGRKLGHSYSKLIHQAFGKYDFDLIELEPDSARDFILNAPYKGLTVTIPYKKLALELADEVAPEAQRIGCANTLVREPDGKLHAYNTDYDGFKLMAKNCGTHFKDAKVLILGSGGTSLTTRTVAADEGAREIVIVSRTGSVNYQNVAQLHADADIIINTTPVGMFPNTELSPLDLAPFSPKTVLDVVYNPMKTRLKLMAEQRGIPVSDGLTMLVAQAKFCMDHFLYENQPDDIIPEVVGLIRRQTANIVLVGMPGSGKSTIAQLIAKQTHKDIISVDEQIAKKAGKPIAEIFQQDGEPAFRTLEQEVIAEVARQSNVILDTGGGAIIRAENRLNLAANGFIYYIQRDLSALELNAGRPLSTSQEKNTLLFREREPLYRQLATHIIDNNTSPEDATQAILGAYHEDSCH